MAPEINLILGTAPLTTTAPILSHPANLYNFHSQIPATKKQISYLKHHFSSNCQYNTCFAGISYSPHASISPHRGSRLLQRSGLLPAPQCSLLFSLSSHHCRPAASSPAAPRKHQKLCLPSGLSLICHSCYQITALTVQLLELHQGI